MKNIFMTIMICGLTTSLFSQTEQSPELVERKCATIGILQGGGSIIGVDVEFLLTQRLGFQVGAGFVGYGGGLNYHFKPTIRSSFVSLHYLNQGVGELFAQNAVGVSYVFRAKKWLTFQIGYGMPLKRSPELQDRFGNTPMLLYSLGIYTMLSSN